jgi:hypothetical protein
MLANLNKMFKRLDVTYNKEELLSLANSLEYNRAYKELGRAIPQEIVPAFGLAHPLIKHITQQLPKVRFYNSSFIRTTPNTIVEPHTDSSGLDNIKRTVNFLFPLKNYNSPLTIYNAGKHIFDITGPIAFRCDLPHSYENQTDDYRIALILQVKHPFTFERLMVTRAI